MSKHASTIIFCVVGLSCLIWTLVSGLEYRTDRLADAFAAVITDTGATPELQTLDRDWWRWIELSNTVATLGLLLFAFGALPMSITAVMLDRFLAPRLHRRSPRGFLYAGLWYQGTATAFSWFECLLAAADGEWVWASGFGLIACASTLAIGAWRRLVFAVRSEPKGTLHISTAG